MRTVLNSPPRPRPGVLTDSPGSHRFTLPESVLLQEREQQPLYIHSLQMSPGIWTALMIRW